MNSFRSHKSEKDRRGGFSLAEVTLSIGLFSFGFLSLAPLLAVGLKAVRFARDDRTSAQIARTLTEEARQGVPLAGVAYFDDQGAPLASAQAAAFTVQSGSQAVADNAALKQLTLCVTPAGAPDRARVYAVIYPAAPSSP